jgi:hypothetical protein
MWLMRSSPTATLKVAVTEVFCVRVTWHEPLPLHAPLHPVNVEPAAGAAVKITAVPWLKFALHNVPQLIPAGLLVTDPEPVPPRVKIKLNVGSELNTAVKEVWVVSVTVQVPVPEHAPPQPTKVEPALGIADRVILLPAVNALAQEEPQSIPPGMLVTMPVPVPDVCTLS